MLNVDLIKECFGIVICFVNMYVNFNWFLFLFFIKNLWFFLVCIKNKLNWCGFLFLYFFISGIIRKWFLGWIVILNLWIWVNIVIKELFFLNIFICKEYLLSWFSLLISLIILLFLVIFIKL